MNKVETSSPAEGGVAAVNRALTALLAFGNAPGGLMLAQVSEETGLNMSTLLRMFESLEQFRFIKRLPDGRYVLGPAVFQLGMMYRESFQLREYVMPILSRLSAETGETAAFYVREGDQRVCLFRIQAQRSVRTHLREGDRFPLDVGAAGRVLEQFDAIPEALHAYCRAEEWEEVDRLLGNNGAELAGHTGVFTACRALRCSSRKRALRVTSSPTMVSGIPASKTMRAASGST